MLLKYYIISYTIIYKYYVIITSYSHLANLAITIITSCLPLKIILFDKLPVLYKSEAHKTERNIIFLFCRFQAKAIKSQLEVMHDACAAT